MRLRWISSGAILRHPTRWAGVVEGTLTGVGIDDRESVALVEAAGVDVALVDIDLDVFGASGLRLASNCGEERGADACAAVVRLHIQLVEQGDWPIEPDVGPQRHDGDGPRRSCVDHREDSVAVEQLHESVGQHPRAWGRNVELGVERVEQFGDGRCVGHGGEERAVARWHLADPSDTRATLGAGAPMDFLPDLATSAPLWLALLTVGVNAVVGALRASIDDTRHWDIVGLSTFALLMGLGGGFIRDMLLGNLPAESLRTPWFLATVLGCIVLVLLVGQRLARVAPLVAVLNALALGLFAVSGTSAALRADLPVISAVFVGTVSAVGGGVLVSVMKDEVPGILLASAPNALVAVLSSVVYAATAVWSARAAAVAGIVAALVAFWVADALGLRTRRAVDASALLLTRGDSDD